MRILIQRVKSASVTIGGQLRSQIGAGLLVLLGVGADDTDEDVEYLAGKLVRLRIFDDAQGVMNLDVRQAGGQVLVVSQFTLLASTRKGNRPSYIKAAPEAVSRPMYERFAARVAELLVEAENGDYHYAYHICPDFKVDGHEARNFTVCYSAEHHSPVWVAAPVHNCYVGSSGNRNYGPDPVIPSSIQPSGSKASMGSPYNRGHMLGNHERSRTSGMNKQVSYYTNIAAQHGSTFNTGDGAWNNLEDKIDDYWCADTLYVVVGAYYDKWTDSYGNSAPQRSTSFGNITTDVPTMFYTLCLRTKKGNTNKSVMNCAADELQCAAFVMSHAMGKGHDPQAGDMRSVKEIEELTGFTFFANVPNAPKDTYNASDWGL